MVPGNKNNTQPTTLHCQIKTTCSDECQNKKKSKLSRKPRFRKVAGFVLSGGMKTAARIPLPDGIALIKVCRSLFLAKTCLCQPPAIDAHVYVGNKQSPHLLLPPNNSRRFQSIHQQKFSKARQMPSNFHGFDGPVPKCYFSPTPVTRHSSKVLPKVSKGVTHCKIEKHDFLQAFVFKVLFKIGTPLAMT